MADAVKDRIVTKIAVQEIRSAPVSKGQQWGPVLLAPGVDGGWTIGEWDGEAWASRDGFLISPKYYGILPLSLGSILDPA